ncbi:MAG: lactate utilization protein [Dehalococcoidales bacterium]|nr:lactate utilization protein [Dehalococcoidales bacterium]
MPEEKSFWETIMPIDRTYNRDTEAWYFEQRCKKAIECLEKNYMKGYYAPDRKSAFATVMELIPPGSVIGYGDSVTLHQIGVIAELRTSKYNFIDPWEPGVSSEESMERRRKALTADVFLSGANAVTLDGKLIYIDGIGNRVAGLLFGPKKVIIAAGANKIVSDAENGIKRVKEIAAPLNAKRHTFRNPCGVTGFCNNCRGELKMCRQIVIIDGEHPGIYPETHTHVVMVGESLGF